MFSTNAPQALFFTITQYRLEPLTITNVTYNTYSHVFEEDAVQMAEAMNNAIPLQEPEEELLPNPQS